MTASATTSDHHLRPFAAEVGTSGRVAVAGGRSRWSLGGDVDADTRIISAPTGIVEYQPSEMTVTVRAGTSVADLDHALAERGQRTALPSRRGPTGPGTVGGALAVGENHLEVLGRGSVSIAALQVRYISAEGALITAGGPTVKNVSGFNLPSLLVGSLGTLGLLADVILRTNPKPAVSQWFVAPDADPFAARDAVLRPGAVLFDGTSTWILLEGHEPDVAAEQSALSGVGTFAATDGPPPLPEHRWSLSPAELRTVDASVGAYVASIGVGTMFAATRQPERRMGTAEATIARRLKERFDPTGRLNPGRNMEAR